MKNILIGSRAINFWESSAKIKPTTDYDIITHKNLDWAECHDPNFLNNASLEKYITEHYIIVNGEKLYPISLEGSAVVKRSHLWRDIKFDRHIALYHHHLQEHLRPDSFSDMIIRRELSYKEFKERHPKLNVTVEKFFDDQVVKKYDHDYLHTLVAYHSQPLYTKLQRNASLAFCEKDLWDELSHIDKIRCISEESMVIALERFIIPSNWTMNIKRAYIMAVKKVCTTLTSGWFRDYAIDFYPDLFSILEVDRIKSLQKILP